MEIKIEKKNFENLNIESMKKEAARALDVLWQEPWLRRSLSGEDAGYVRQAAELSETLGESCDTVVILASEEVYPLLQGLVNLLQGTGGRSLIVFGDSLSAFEYAQLLEKLSGRDFALIAVSSGHESLALRSSFACLKQALMSNLHGQVAGGRLFALTGKGSKVIAMDAAENDYPLISLPEGENLLYGGNSILALLILALAGADGEDYLQGFRQMIASPVWDLDGADYAVARAICCKEKKVNEQNLIWQKQLLGVANWSSQLFKSENRQSLYLPREAGSVENGFLTAFLLREEDTDIMTPYFTGCHEDGSLSRLCVDTARKYFFENIKDTPAAMIQMERLNSNIIGQLLAFLQISGEITKFLLNK